MMKICKSAVILSAVLALATSATLRADEEKPDLPVGYEQAGQAGKTQKKPRRRIVVPAVPRAEDDAKAPDDELFEKNPQLKALVKQMRPQLMTVFAAELTFAKEVCQPNDEQLQKMKALASPEFEKVLRTFAWQQAPRMGIQIARVANIRQQRQQPSEILDLFETSAGEIVVNVFPEETVKRYQAEQKHRREFRARSGAMALVAHLDESFRLSQDQREAITDSIQQAWQREWEPYLQFLASNPQFFPKVPDESIVPHLTDVQVKQWRGKQRQTIYLSWQHLNNNNRFFRDMKPEDDWFEKKEKKAVGVGGVFQQFRVQVQAAVVEAVEQREEAEEQ